VVNLLLKLTREQKRLILLLLDALLAPLAFFVALVIHYNGVLPEAILGGAGGLMSALLALTLTVSLILRVPDIRPKDFDRAAALRIAAFAVCLAVGTATVAWLQGVAVAAGCFAVFAMVFFAFSAGSRIAMLHLLLWIYGRSRAITNVLIYGAGRTGMMVAAALRKRPDIVPLAFVDDNPSLAGFSVVGLPVYPARDVQTLCALARIDRVIIAIPSLSLHRRALIAQRFEALGAEVWTLPAFSDLMGEAGLLDKLLPAAPRAILHREEALSSQAHALDIYSGASVMITGAGGTIGQELCRQVLALRPRRLVLFDLNEFSLFTVEQELEAPARDAGVELVTVLGSVADAALVSATLGGQDVEIILHAAAYKHVPLVQKNMLSGLANNAVGTDVLSQKAREHGVARFVLVSTDKAVRPKNVMGASKRVAEILVQDLASRADRTIFSAVRFGNVLGSSGSVLPLFQEQILRGGPVTVTDPAATRYFMTVEEASALVLLASAFAEGGEIFALDMGEPIAIGTLARRLVELSGFTVRDEQNRDGDIEIIATGLRPGEKRHEERMVRSGVITTAHPRIARIADPGLSEIETASLMRDLRDAVQRTDEAAALVALGRWLPGFAAQNDQSRPLDEDRRAAQS
jgi:FlaA1/EpsC-like NDP-sugar epimerase